MVYIVKFAKRLYNTFINNLIKVIIKALPSQPVYAHCDIPCGIYDPHQMQLAAHTVLRMVNLIKELEASSAEPPFEERKRIISQISRFTKIKEEHAELIKHEVRILWGDYFKEEHLMDNPELHNLVWKIIKFASKAKQNVDELAAGELLAAVQEFAEIFYKTKGVEPIRIKSIYPTEGEIVIYK